MSLHEVARSLFGGNGDERHAFVRGLKPNNLWLVLLAILLMTAGAAFPLLTLGFLFLFGGLTAGSQKP